MRYRFTSMMLPPPEGSLLVHMAHTTLTLCLFSLSSLFFCDIYVGQVPEDELSPKLRPFATKFVGVSASTAEALTILLLSLSLS